ncbi:DUF5753 domain-containing protein [Spirillospora sp. CA-294931]|uniref:DUF5753 domain-containing protein n=1 Tax=Spirillospora sp. CA-294931 TaxID=3240042 RepID=UPI003D8DDA19
MVNRNQSPDPRASMWDFIAYYLRFQRLERGETARRLGEILKVGDASTSRIENADGQRLSEAQARRVDDAWNMGKLFELLVYYARRASDPDWFRNLTKYEQTARELRIFGALHVPGVVQTVEYARALLESGRNPNVERALSSRMKRQEILSKPNPPDLWITVTENVTDWPVGDRDVMTDQLSRLLELAKLPHVVFRVLPRSSGASEALDGPFQVVSTIDDGVVAFVEAAVEGRLVSDSDDVNAFRNRFDRISAKAFSEDQSQELLREKMEKLYGKHDVA